VADFPDREGQYAQREELSRAWAIVDNQTAEIEALEARHAALVAAARKTLADQHMRGNVNDTAYDALRAVLEQHD
jgi:hypothetical protein